MDDTQKQARGTGKTGGNRETAGNRGTREIGENRGTGETKKTGGNRETRETRETRGAIEARETRETGEESNRIEGRNAVLEAFRAGRSVDKLFLLDNSQDGPIRTLVREAKKAGCVLNFVSKERLDQLSDTGKHQGAIAYVAAYDYVELDDILQKAKDAGEPPFLILLDNIEDPHNLGAIIRSANMAGAHGVVIPKHRAVGLTAVVAKASAGALNYTPVAKVTNLSETILRLQKEGMWFVCADASGTEMYKLDLTGPIGLVIGSEGEGVSRLVREKCDFTAAIPTRGDIDSLNASVAAGVLAFEILHQRMVKQNGK